MGLHEGPIFANDPIHVLSRRYISTRSCVKSYLRKSFSAIKWVSAGTKILNFKGNKVGNVLQTYT